MIGSEFIDLISKLHLVDFVSVDDFADKMSYMYSVLILMLCALIVTFKQYFLSAIVCYIPTVPSGSDFDKFLENYCWVHGTIPLTGQDKMPSTLDDWAVMDRTYRISYYQWVPFMFGIQCVLFYLPRLFWQLLCSNRAGIDLENLIGQAVKASNANQSREREKMTDHVAQSMHSMLRQHREYRHGHLVDVRNRVFNACGLLVVSKRLGTWVAWSYLIIKLLYVMNAIGQIVIMQHFLGSRGLYSFGPQLLHYIVKGASWEETRLFPRITFCYMADLRQLGATNRYVAQCVLPINMLNEKIYIFLWYWTFLVLIASLFSILLWLLRLVVVKNRHRFVKKFLRINQLVDTKIDRNLVLEFVDDFLKHDGLFLLRMISLNAGDVITSEIVQNLWNRFCKRCTDSLVARPSQSLEEHVLLKQQQAIENEKNVESNDSQVKPRVRSHEV